MEHLIEQVKFLSFEKLLQQETLKMTLFLLDNLNLLSSRLLVDVYNHLQKRTDSDLQPISIFQPHPLAELVKDFGASTLAKYSKLEILYLFSQMIHSETNLHRQIAYYVRMFYIDAIYGSDIGARIGGFPDPGQAKAAILPPFPKVSNPNISYNKRKHRFEGHIHTLFVGSGAAAMTGGARLQAEGLSVMLVEKGSLIIPGAVNTVTNLNYMVKRAPIISEEGQLIMMIPEITFGGTGLNLDMSVDPTSPFVMHRIHEWHRKGLIEPDIFTDKQIRRAYRKVKKMLQPRRVDETEINANNGVLQRGCENLGYHYQLFELNNSAPDELAPGAIMSKKSRFHTILEPAMLDEINPLILLSDCEVEKVLIKKGRAYGVRCRYMPRDEGLGAINDIYGFGIKPGTRVKIYADNVVLAAGAWGSTQVLSQSNVDNPNIGQGYNIHPFVPVMGIFDEEIRADLGEPSSIFVDHFAKTDEEPDNLGFLIEAGLGRVSLGALMMPGSPEQVRENVERGIHAAGFAVILPDTASEHNRLELGHDGRLRAYYQMADEDREAMIEGIKTAVRILFSDGAHEVTFNSFETPLFQGDDDMFSNTLTPDMDIEEVFADFSLIPNQTNFFGAHLMGTNKMGTNPENGVVNSDFQVFGVDNLYLIDAGVFPTTVGANPEMMIHTTAMIFAERFIGSRRGYQD